ncbi:MAG TPA: tetratricopeptide repeat protein, partial [Roseiflexaceae bacterium]|nr:tetratricopeptide repeat protein [Roseiflexaceae bacterium]
WSDASSLELLERIARAAVRIAVLLVFNYRSDPPLAAPWRAYGYAVTVELDELSPAASARLVRSLLRGEPPPELEQRLERAQGNPFFIEAVVRSLIESGTLVQQDGTWRLAHRLDEADIPDSIEGVITARLDRLEESLRETLQVAAVIGRRFGYSVLNGLIQPPDTLPTRLERLEASDMVVPDSEGRDSHARSAYQFVHALTRDVAYEGILYVRRRDLHLRVAQRIEALYGQRADEQLSLLAGHYLLAESWAKAFDYHVRAGRRAQERFANREAIALFERALDIAERFETPPGIDILTELHERMGAIHALIGEYDQALVRFELALSQLQQHHAPPLEDLLRLHHHVARVYEKRANFDTAFDWVERAIALAGQRQTPFMSRCLLLGAGIHQRQGRYALALEWGERARLLAERFGSERDQAAALLLLGGTYRNLGDNNRAFELTDRSLQLYQGVQELSRLADAHNNMANICFELGRLAEARTHYEAGGEIKRAIGDVYGEGLIACNLGELFRVQGETEQAINQYAQA